MAMTTPAPGTCHDETRKTPLSEDDAALAKSILDVLRDTTLDRQAKVEQLLSLMDSLSSVAESRRWARLRRAITERKRQQGKLSTPARSADDLANKLLGTTATRSIQERRQSGATNTDDFLAKVTKR